ncbi:TraR/DksA family transcriptional regulator [Paractinoplanes rishiriensis]|uniref:Zinc finger DksA/TraR C4-type domain-containing protein n=1 Tax=Paractinoplanes rishiriensis TaxID=1050105 RepID=A0A919K870_9ACTN|nr:TraR/DksA family transcriptional regulator [Actinoplanes rishiriensis]GIF01163.1 hypothetical protein Ari01nite_86270 [Actinoplanes rishiriensis]
MPTRTAPPPVDLRDEQRDLHTLAWDLTVQQMHLAFAECVLPTPDQADEAGRSAKLARVRLAAARYAVEDIRAALQRIDAGTYGMCLQCGCIIAADRLRARPTARWCAVCQV